MNEISEKAKRAQQLINEFTAIIKDLRQAKDEQARFYNYAVSQLPRTTLVLKKFKEKDCSFLGETSLYSSEEEQFALSGRNKRKFRITFRFFANQQEAIVYSGYYCGRELYKGPWPGAVIFILNKIKKSTAFRALSPEQRSSLKGMIKTLGWKNTSPI